MMRKFTNISVYNLIFLLFFSANILFVHSSPDERGDKMRERVRTMKKVKLIEVLDLSEDKLDRFIVKYSLTEKKMEKQMKDFDSVEKKLRLALKDENEKETTKYISEFEESRRRLNEMNDEKINMARGILSDKEFAKFLIFEKVFRRELSKKLFQGRGGKREKRGKRRP
jgi:hypothetical protein